LQTCVAAVASVRGRLDVLVAFSSALAVGVTVFWLIEGAYGGWGQPAVVIALAVAALGLAAFVVAELRADDPLLDVRYFRRRGFTTGALSVTLQFLTTFGFFLLIVQYLQMVKGYGAIGAS